MSITQSECVFVALSTQHAMLMRNIVIVACPALQYFSALCDEGLICEKKCYWTPNAYFDFFYDIFWNISYSEKKWSTHD